MKWKEEWQAGIFGLCLRIEQKSMCVKQRLRPDAAIEIERRVPRL